MRAARALAARLAASAARDGRRGVGHSTPSTAPRSHHAPPDPPPRRSAFDGLPPPGADAAEAAAAGAAAAEAAPPALPAPVRLAARVLFGGAVLAAAGAAALTATHTQDEADKLADEAPAGVKPLLAWYAKTRASLTATVDSYANPPTDRLLPDLPPHATHVRTLVLDLDDVLVHSHWTRGRGWRTFKRPGVDDFLKGAAQYYEVVVYTSQLPTYADPILDRLDPNRYIQYRLYRDSTRYTAGGVHARDVAALNRDPSRVLLVTADPATAAASPSNAVLVHGWAGADPADTGLLDLLPFLEAVFRTDVADVRAVVDAYRGKDVAVAFRERMAARAARDGKRGFAAAARG